MTVTAPIPPAVFFCVVGVTESRRGVSKLAQCLYTRELARRPRAEGKSQITALVVDPGAVGSEGGLAGLSSFPILARWLFRLIQSPPEHAARGAIRASTLPAEEVARLNGRVVEKALLTGSVGPAAWTDLMADGTWAPLAAELWATSERVVRERLAGVSEADTETARVSVS